MHTFRVLFGHVLLLYVFTPLLVLAAIYNVAFVASGVEERGIKVGGNPYSITVNPDTDMVYVADKLSKRIFFVDGSTGEVIKKVNLTNISPNSSFIRETDYFRGIGLTPSIAVSKSSNLLYVAYTDSDSLWVLDGSTGEFVSGIKVKGIPRSVYADSSSQYVYVSTLDYSNPNNTKNLIHEIAGAANTISKIEELNTKSNVTAITATTTGFGSNQQDITVYAAAGDFNERGQILSIESNINLSVTTFGDQNVLWNFTSDGIQLHDIGFNPKDSPNNKT